MSSSYFNAHQLSIRGWPPSLITLLLGEPDLTRVRAHSRSALYAVERVEAAERHPDFAAFQVQKRSRRTAAKR